MKLLTALAACAVVLVNVPAQGGDASASNVGAAGPYVQGPWWLADVGIATPSDIESVLLVFVSGERCMVTYKHNATFVTRLYKAVLGLGALATRAGPGYDYLILNARDGSTVVMCFYTLAAERPGDVDQYYISDSIHLHSEALDSVINDVRRAPSAAHMGARIGEFKVKEVQVNLPRRKGIRMAPTIGGVLPLMAKARTIIDWVDVRLVPGRVDASGELERALYKFGGVTLILESPVFIDLYDFLDPEEDPGRYDRGSAIYRNLRRRSIRCDGLTIMEYGNYLPPAVVARCTGWPDILFVDLDRREWERIRAEKFGLPSRPASDREYYKSPGVLYQELQVLAKKAYEAFAKKD